MVRPRNPAGIGTQARPPGSAAASPAGMPADSRTATSPVEELEARFPDEWVVVRVTELDEHQQVSGGELLAHCRSQKKAWQVVVQASREDPNAQIYLFLGGTPPGTAAEWRERLAEAAGKVKNYRDAW
jgi:hypothetical protein